MSDFDFSLVPSLDRNLAMRMFEEEFIDTGDSAIIIGRPGVGKTYIASALIDAVTARGKTAELFRPCMPLNAGLRDSSCVQSLEQCDLLVIDDLQPGEASELVGELILKRHHYRKSTLIISKFTLIEIRNRNFFGTSTLSVLRRLEIRSATQGVSPWHVIHITE
jgi:DNA replication protein DnaC